MLKHKLKIIIFIICMMCGINTVNAPSAYAKTSAISKAPAKDVYYKCPKTKFADKVFIMKHSYYSKIHFDYTNEYFRQKQSRSNWTEKIVINNYISVHLPVDYAYEIASKHKGGKVMYQLKYKMAIVCYTQKVKVGGKTKNQIVLEKIDLNPHAPGVQVASYIFIQNIAGSNKQSEEFKKLIIDKCMLNLLEFYTPMLYRYDLSVK